MISGQDALRDKKTKSPNSSKTQYEIHPIVSDLKELLSPLILNKHLEQFNLSNNYRITSKYWEIKNAVSRECNILNH